MKDKAACVPRRVSVLTGGCSGRMEVLTPDSGPNTRLRRSYAAAGATSQLRSFDRRVWLCRDFRRPS
jgi:hypothetical protein